MEKFHTGFTKVFPSYSVAYAFYQANKYRVEPGTIMAIPLENLNSVRVRPTEDIQPHKTKRPHYAIEPKHLTDDLGAQGLLNHADGKLYDSKSAFRKATRRAGCYEVGNDVKREHIESHKRETMGDFNVRPQLKEALHKVIGV